MHGRTREGVGCDEIFTREVMDGEAVPHQTETKADDSRRKLVETFGAEQWHERFVVSLEAEW